MKINVRKGVILTAMWVFIGGVIHKIINVNPERVLPNPKEQLNTNFEESKLLFKYVDTNDVSTIVVVLTVLCIILVWYKIIKIERGQNEKN